MENRLGKSLALHSRGGFSNKMPLPRPNGVPMVLLEVESQQQFEVVISGQISSKKPLKGSVLEGKWDPENAISGKSRFVKYSIWPDIWSKNTRDQYCEAVNI